MDVLVFLGVIGVLAVLAYGLFGLLASLDIPYYIALGLTFVATCFVPFFGIFAAFGFLAIVAYVKANPDSNLFS